MKLLLKAAFSHPKQRLFLFFIVFSMCLLTFASQLEMLALGVLTKKGPDIFELFAPEVDGVLQRTGALSKEEMEERWQKIVPHGEELTEERVKAFLALHKSEDRIQQATRFINRFFPISKSLTTLALLLLLVALYKAAALFTYNYSTKTLAIRVSRDLRQQYFDHIQLLSMNFYQRYNIGSISSRVVNDTLAVGEAVNAVLVNYIQTPFTTVTTMALCFFTSWQLSLVVFLGFPLIILPISYIAKHVRRVARQLQRRQEQLSSLLVDFLSGILTVKVFSMEELSRKKYWEENQQMARLEKKEARYDLSSRPVVHTIAISFLAGSLLWGLHILHLSLSETFFFCGLLIVFYEPIKKFAEQNSKIQRGIAASERMQEILSLKPQVQDRPDAIPLSTFSDSIVFDHVSFGYVKGRPILSNLSFTIRKGETVAIVGPTGAGKSTTVQLILRLYDTSEGQILIDGKPLQCYTQHSLRQQIAFVPQSPFLFLDTIADNITCGKEASREAIEEAAKKAHAHAFITELPQGYLTPLVQAGSNLSGGQQQRLAIARALFKQAPILIMDEATSSLDAISEKKIKEALQQLHGQVTQIIIAHRLSTIEDADCILYLDKGRKIAQGTKDELLKNCPDFRHMWEALHKGAKQ